MKLLAICVRKHCSSSITHQIKAILLHTMNNNNNNNNNIYIYACISYSMYYKLYALLARCRESHNFHNNIIAMAAYVSVQ